MPVGEAQRQQIIKELYIIFRNKFRKPSEPAIPAKHRDTKISGPNRPIFGQSHRVFDLKRPIGGRYRELLSELTLRDSGQRPTQTREARISGRTRLRSLSSPGPDPLGAIGHAEMKGAGL